MTTDDRPVAEQVRLDGPIEWTERVAPDHGYVEKRYSMDVEDLLIEWDNPCLVRALLLRLRALLAERDALRKQSDVDSKWLTQVKAERDVLAHEAEQLELALRMSTGPLWLATLDERDALRQRVTELAAQVAYVQAQNETCMARMQEAEAALLDSQQRIKAMEREEAIAVAFFGKTEAEHATLRARLDEIEPLGWTERTKAQKAREDHS
jgi:hypothetical protein